MQYDIYYDNSSNVMSRIMRKVFMKMFLALLVSAATSLLIISISELPFFIKTRSIVYIVVMIAEIGLVLGINSALSKLNNAKATLLFYIFAIVNAVTLSLIFITFSDESILKTFIITAGIFGGMSLYGYFTNRDLSSFGSILVMALWGLMLALVVNIFWSNDALQMIITFAGVIIFVGLTAWDTQKIKLMAESGQADESAVATLGALSLYLDFVNLFIILLRIFGSQRN